MFDPTKMRAIPERRRYPEGHGLFMEHDYRALVKILDDRSTLDMLEFDLEVVEVKNQGKFITKSVGDRFTVSQSTNVAFYGMWRLDVN